MPARWMLLFTGISSLALPTLAHGQTPVSSGGGAGGLQSGAPPASAAATSGQAATVGEIVVTARQRSEALQSVPLAVSAFTQANLKAERIESGAELVEAVPNLNFVSGTTNNNFSIRGIGYQVLASSADAGIATHENDAPLIVSRVASADFYDIERIEVLRGPQGTLYGRNATGGVVNTITAKPVDHFDASLTGEYGNYNTVRLQGFVNAPLNDMFSLRLAGTYLRHDGFQKNVTTGDDVDDRDLFSTRVTLGFHPTERLHGTLMWEHFEEDDSRTGGAKPICQEDPGPTSIGGVAVTNVAAQGILSRGCERTSLYGSAAQAGQPNPLGALYVLNTLVGQLPAKPVLRPGSPADFRSIALDSDPTYYVKNDLYQLDLEYDLTDKLVLRSLSSYSRDTFANLTSGVPLAGFNTTALTPSGVFNDPRFGPGGITTDERYYDDDDKQASEELRLQSHFSGPVNFSAGAIYLNLKRYDILVTGNRAFTAYSAAFDAAGGTIYIDPNATPSGLGHNYYFGLTPYELNSYAGFGELYWQFAPEWRLTLGGRYSVDRKSQPVYPIELFQPGAGFPSSIVKQTVQFEEPTGRAVLDWSPRLGFTDKTLVYASYSRGYKAGGFNQPDVTEISPAYAPEFVNAFELGAKNTLLGGKMTLNLTGFYYDYTGYQVSQTAGLTTVTVNVDATVKGAELESVFQPTRALRFNLNAGYVDAEINGGSSINAADRTADDPDYVVLHSVTTRCIALASDVAPLIRFVDAGVLAPSTLLGACPTAAAPGGPFSSTNPTGNPLAKLGINIPTSFGVATSLDGKDLPNTPHWTASFGAQYTREVTAEWDATLRGDFYYQSSSYSTIYNDFSDQFKSYTNVNATLSFRNDHLGLQAQLFVKNLFDKDAITGVVTGTDLAGLVRTRFANDPRTFGVSFTKSFR